jgi:hypothetical protein
VTADDLMPGYRDELVRAASRQIRRRQRRRRLAGVAALGAATAAVLTLALNLANPDRAEAGVEITERNGRIEVSLTDVETRPDVVEDALNDAGIDATVAAVPVGPSNVGRFAGFTADDPDSVQPIDARGRTFPGFSVPIDYAGHLELRLGRPAELGEPYAEYSDAYLAGEPLHCAGVYGQPATVLADFAADRPELEIDVEPFVDGAPAGDRLSLEAVSNSPFAGYLVVEARSPEPDSVIVRITPDGSSPARLTPPEPCPDD